MMETIVEELDILILLVLKELQDMQKEQKINPKLAGIGIELIRARTELSID